MSTMNIPRMSSAVPSASSTPSASPTTEHHDRLNALLATFEAGTHAFTRGDEWSDGARISKQDKARFMSSQSEHLARPQPTPQQQPQQARRGSSWALSLLSLSRPDQPRHFDPSREPKLHGLP